MPGAREIVLLLFVLGGGAMILWTILGSAKNMKKYGNLFWGHSVQVCMDANDKCTGTQIAG